MNPLLMKLLSRYMAPAGDDGSDTGGAGSGGDDGDRGDDFTPTDDDADSGDGKGKGKGQGAKDDDDDIDPEDPDDETKGKGEGEDDKDKKPKGRDNRIPLSRHKDIVEKERAKRAELERQLAQYQQGKQVAAVNEDITKAEDKIIELEKQYAKLMSDGEGDKAAEVMGKIRRMERDVVEQKAELKIAAAEARATENARYSVVLERIEAAYPELNEDHDDYDEEIAQDVLDLKAAYQARRGMTPSAALQAAVMKLLGKKTSSQKDAVSITPRVPKDEGKDKGKQDPAKQEETAADRKKKAVEKALDAQKRTPPDASKVGVDSDKIGGALTAQMAMKLPDADFNKLDEKALARMRGDEL